MSDRLDARRDPLAALHVLALARRDRQVRLLGQAVRQAADAEGHLRRAGERAAALGGAAQPGERIDPVLEQWRQHERAHCAERLHAARHAAAAHARGVSEARQTVLFAQGRCDALQSLRRLQLALDDQLRQRRAQAEADDDWLQRRGGARPGGRP